MYVVVRDTSGTGMAEGLRFEGLWLLDGEEWVRCDLREVQLRNGADRVYLRIAPFSEAFSPVGPVDLVALLHLGPTRFWMAQRDLPSTYGF